MIRIAMLALLLLSTGVAGQYTDPEGDAIDGLDLLALDWSSSNRTIVTLNAPLPDDAAVTAMMYVGTQGNSEPDTVVAWHLGPGGARRLDVNTGDEEPVQMTRNGSTVVILDGPLESHRAQCHFLVARTVTYPVGGQEIHDVIGWRTEDIGGAWDQGRACTEGQPVDAVIESAKQATIPGPAVIAVLAGLFLLRRSQR